MRDVAVLVPYGNETPWRKRSLEYVKTWYSGELEGARVVTGESGQPWCKAEAVSRALHVTDEPVLVIADADCVTPGIRLAVRAVMSGAPWAVPHLKVYRMSPEATDRITQGVHPGSLTVQNKWLDQQPYKGYEGGGITVVRREVYERAPLDPLFRGWGQEDEAWALALNALCGPAWRGVAPLYHLWHEKPPRMSRYAGSAPSLDRLARYRYAGPQDWESLLGQARDLALSGKMAK